MLNKELLRWILRLRNLLRKVKKPLFLAVNKVDNAMRDADAVEFYNLGLGEYHTISLLTEVELENY